VELSIRITGLTAERLIDPNASLPQGLIVTVNVSIQGFIKLEGNERAANFTFDVVYNPPIARVTVRGTTYLRGSEEEIKKVDNELKGNKVPAEIAQAITSTSLAEAIVLCRSIGVPPPLPMMLPVQRQQPDYMV
jgi:hypothetical protein